MEKYNQQQPFTDYTVVGAKQQTVVESNAASRKFIANVFLWMFAALGVSTLFAFLFATNYSLLSLLVSARGLTPFGFIVIFAPIAFVLLMRYGLEKFSFPAIVGLFIAYAAVTGISLSFILVVYTSASVMGCFASAAAMFGVMAIMGYTTDKDLTSFGRILMMGLIGILVAMLINFFLHSQQMDYIISIIGVMVFTGLTAYDVQVLKRIGAGAEYDGISTDGMRKASVFGALRLYLDFINLFLMLLRLFGRRK